MIRSTPVACSSARMLRPSRPMIRPFISSDGRWTTRHRVLGRVVRGDALHRGQDDVAGLVLGLLARGALDGAGELDGVVLGLGADGLEEHGLGVLGSHARHALERHDLLLGRAGKVFLRLVELALAVEELAVALLEHLRRAGRAARRAATRRRSWAVSSLRRARASSSASRAEAQLLVLRLEDQFLLAGAGLGLDAAGFRLGGLHALRCPHAPDQSAEYGSADGGQQRPPPPRSVSPSVVLPSGPDHAAGRVTCAKARSREARRYRRRTMAVAWSRTVGSTVRAPSLGRDRAGASVRKRLFMGDLERPASVGPSLRRVNRGCCPGALPAPASALRREPPARARQAPVEPPDVPISV